jgi:sialate O-acetylesterase
MNNNKLELAQVFSSNMVLQRNCNIPIWGNAEDGAKVIIKFSNQIKEVQALNGKWITYLEPISEGGPYEMEIKSGAALIVLKKILIGDVWVAGGQSNMEFNLKDTIDAKEEIEAANFANIRYYQVPKIDYEDETTESIDNPGWQLCTTENAGYFSAVAYHFAKNITKEIGVPVGIINCNRGGTSASCWVSEEYLASDNDTKIYLEEYYEHLKKVSDEEFEIQVVEYNKSLEEYNKNIENYKALHPQALMGEMDEKVGLYPWPPPLGKKSFNRPNGLYNVMVKKVAPYGIKGFIWYQGEEDSTKCRIYKKLFGMVIKNWRELWNNSELPFLFVQLPSYGDGDPKLENWPRIREAQLLTMKEDNNTAMAVAIDCGEEDNVHPINKKPVGERVALLARAKVYKQDIVYSGPIFRDIKIEGNKALLSFDHIGTGLIFKGEEAVGFKICGQDKKFLPATAQIKGDIIEVYSDEIIEPLAVRYGWSNYEKINLYNKEALPTSPFRTDDF